MDQYDEVDVYGTFTPAEARRIGVVPLEDNASITGIRRESEVHVEVDNEKR
jgi:NCS1 family nucleobase:cation symporter-1